jgi:putative phage-type endonuclease
MGVLQLEQGTQEWLDWRKTIIGGSDAPVIMGFNQWSTQYNLWEDKLGLSKPKVDNFAMSRGRELEPVARDVFERETLTCVSPQVVVSDEYGWMGASFDGVSECGKVAVEIKCPGDKAHEMAKNKIVPDYYYPQLQHSIAVKNLDMIFYFSFKNESDYALIEVKRNQDYIDDMVQKEWGFWERVRNFEAPEMISRDFVSVDTNEWDRAARDYLLAKNNVELWTKKLDEYRDHLIEMANNSNCIGGGLRLTKTTRKGAVNYKNIPELVGVDLEKYRGKTVIGWRLDKYGDKTA